MKKIIRYLSWLLLIWGIYTFYSIGFFRSVKNKYSGEILKKVNIKGAEDITVSLSDSFAIISATNRIVYPPTEKEKGALYMMELKSGKFNIKCLTTSFKNDFAPHGISMIKVDNNYKIIAVNHTEAGNFLEIFQLQGDSLTHEKTLSNPLIASPNDVVMVNENCFYFTNDHGYTKGIGKFLEENLALPVSDVVYYDGIGYRKVAGGIVYANGINYDFKRNLLYIASPRKFLVKVYSRKKDGSLEFVENIDCGMGVDNIELDKEGNLWIGGHPDLLAFKSYAKGYRDKAPSEIIKVSYTGKNNYKVEEIFEDDGSNMSACTVAAIFGNYILTGNVKDNHFLILKQ